MKTTTTERKTIADAVELLKEESPNAPGNIAGVQLVPIEKVRAFKDQEAADGDVQESSIRQTRIFLTEYGAIWRREFFLPLLMMGY